MPLQLYRRPTGIYHIRGVVQGRRVDRSAQTRVRAEAEAIRANLEADLFRRAIYGDASVATFAEAAIGYMKAGGERDHLPALLHAFGSTRLAEINQTTLDDYAATRDVAASTLIRQVYTPALAVLNFAAQQGLCNRPAIRKPKIRTTRTDYLTPDQVEAWLDHLPPHLSRLVTFLAGTGCRITEALTLQWEDVSPEAERVVFHPPCSLQHGQKIRGVVEGLLQSLGAEVLPFAESHLCCGSAGTYSVLQPELAYPLRDRKLAHLEGAQPQVILSANIGCITHLASGTATPVLHWIEWIDRRLQAV